MIAVTGPLWRERFGATFGPFLRVRTDMMVSPWRVKATFGEYWRVFW